MITQEQKDQFARDGFLVLPQFLPADEFQLLNRELDRYISDVVPGLEDKYAFYVDKERPETLKQLQYMDVDPFFKEYVNHPLWNQMASELLEEPVIVQGAEWFNKPAGTSHPTPPHQDNYYFCWAPPNVITCWLALDEIDEENGCLRYVVGSHKKPVRPHGRTSMIGFSQEVLDFGPDDEALEVPTRLQPGDVVLHHGNTIHRAEPNRTADRDRRAFGLVIRGESCQRDEEAYAKYLENSKKQHELLGLKS